MLPRRLKQFNVMVAGFGLAGICTEVTLPKLTRKLEEYRAAGMNGPVKTDHGHDALKMELTLADPVFSLIQTWGVQSIEGVGLTFRAALERETVDPLVAGYEITARGRFGEIDYGSAKGGDANEVKAMFEVAYIKITDAGTELIEIDTLNMIERVNGVDRLAEHRQALGL